jgi:hypothetical protein
MRSPQAGPVMIGPEGLWRLRHNAALLRMRRARPSAAAIVIVV